MLNKKRINLLESALEPRGAATFAYLFIPDTPSFSYYYDYCFSFSLCFFFLPVLRKNGESNWRIQSAQHLNRIKGHMSPQSYILQSTHPHWYVCFNWQTVSNRVRCCGDGLLRRLVCPCVCGRTSWEITQTWWWWTTGWEWILGSRWGAQQLGCLALDRVRSRNWRL